MQIHARYSFENGEMVAINLGGADFDTEVTWNEAVFNHVDSRFVERQGDTITLRAEEGVATYRVVGPGPVVGTLLSRLAGVERAERA